MLYPKKKEKELEAALFENPTSEYRGAPFWAWNGKLDQKLLDEEIEVMKRMGMGGFHMHVRTGMDSPYLNEEFMGYIKACIEKGKEEGMLAYLYDEDRWSSGTAGGLVTDGHPEYASKYLMLTTKPYEGEGKECEESKPLHGKGPVRNENGVLLTVFDVLLHEDGTLRSYKEISPADMPEGKKWYVYLEHGAKDPWYNDAAYVDTLSDAAISRFLEITHERYKEAVGEQFGKEVPSIFTDEPQFSDKNTLSFAGEEKDVFLPWTTDLEETFEKAYGTALLANLPQLIWELPGGEVSLLRYQYHNHLADRFVKAYCAQIGSWCDRNGIALTGHVLGEESLYSQTSCLGEAMRCYRHFGIPGIDLLCDLHEYTTAKQCQSVVHQMGAEGMLCELYGVTGWDCDFRTYKLQGDWLAALGVTLRVPHLFWMTMKGEAKRDYPASIGYQSPWYEQFPMIEDHFARVNTAMTRGVPKVRVAVLHPIESYWLHWGPEEQTAAVREALENSFSNLARTLLFGTIDFDYISENELPYFQDEAFASWSVKEQNGEEQEAGMSRLWKAQKEEKAQLQKAQGENVVQSDKKDRVTFHVGKMEYDAVVVCGCETIRSETIERLKRFRQAGGDLLFIGEPPKYVDARPSEAGKELCRKARQVSENGTAILEALEPYRFLSIYRSSGERENRILYQLRQDEDCMWLFLATGKNPTCKDVDELEDEVRIVLKGNFKVTLYDTMTGEIYPCETTWDGTNTTLRKRWYMHDSLLLRLEAEEPEVDSQAENKSMDAYEKVKSSGEAPIRLFHPVDVILEEPNMLLLDMAEYKVDADPETGSGEYEPMEEILRLDNIVRKRLGIPLRRKEVTQPYKVAKETPKHSVTLRFKIQSRVAVPSPELALEDVELAKIYVNSIPLKKEITGWYVDRSISKIKLPDLPEGETILEVTLPIGRQTNLEDLYLLGDFGVSICGTEKTLTAPVRKLGFGDFTHQGLPFYTGNLRYAFDVVTQGDLTIRAPRYRGGLMAVFVDGKDCGKIAFSPYTLCVKGLKPGAHRVELMLYGTRQNGFGQLHHTPGVWFYQSPNSYRSSGDLWCYEYQFKEAGILTSPYIYVGSSKRSENASIREEGIRVTGNIM